VEFTCSPAELPSHSDVFLELARNANEFDNAFVYLLIHYTIDDEAPKTEVHIQNVQHVYPLDYESQREFATSFDERIEICAPIWNDAVVDLQKYWSVQSCLSGAKNIWQIFDIKYPIENVRQIITDEYVKEIVHLLYSNQDPYGDLPLTIYLLRYERHSFYPKSPRGFFMDTVHVWCNFWAKGLARQEDVEGTGAYKVLSKIKDKERYPDIIKKCYKDKGMAALLSKLKEDSPAYPYIEVAPLFLFLRTYYSEGIGKDYMQTYNLLKGYTSEENLAIALYMLGIVLGHEKTYDALYETLPLAIYKPIVVKEPIVEKPQPKAPKKGGSGKNTAKKSTSKPAKQEIVEGVHMEITPPHVEPTIPEQQEAITIPSKMNEVPEEETIEGGQRNLFGELEQPATDKPKRGRSSSSKTKRK
jgi:hypothetical protein